MTPAVTAANKVYDGTTAATLTSCTRRRARWRATSSRAPARRRFDTPSVGTGKTVTVTGLTLTGAAAGNYVLSSTTATTTAAITALTVTPAITAANKVYDGTTSATLTSCTVTGALGDDVVRAPARRRSTRRRVGTGKTVTATGLTLTGRRPANYVLVVHHGDDHGGQLRR